MIKKLLCLVFLLLLTIACYQPQRECERFRNGTFTFTTTLNGTEKTTTFVRNEKVEIDYYQGSADTAAVRWINDCEYVVRKLNPRNKAEEKSIHMKILSTTDNSYTFEYKVVGETKKFQGTAIKTN